MSHRTITARKLLSLNRRLATGCVAQEANSFSKGNQRYEQQENGLVLLQWFATVDELQNAADAINRYCSAFVALCLAIVVANLWIGIGPD